MPVKKLTTEKVIEALEKANGNISMTARQLNVDRKAIQYYIQTYPTVKAAHDAAAEKINDIAEGHLVNAVLKGNLDQVRYWLENKARDRGYGRGQPHDPILNITPDDLKEMSDADLEKLKAQLAKLIR